jgi:transcriptional antiterminator
MNQHKMYRVIKLINLMKEKPRTVMAISRYLNVSERTVYRYFHLFRELEYKVKCDIYYKYYIENEQRKQTTT